MPAHAPTTTEQGAGLARGPALIVGTILAVFGLILFFRAPGTPLSTAGFPDATASGDRFLGFELNAWTAWFTTAAGIALLIGAAQHLAAKTVSLVVGLVLGAASVIAIVDGNDVLGLAAANGLTALGWGVAAAVLLANTLLPRLRHERTDDRAAADDHDRLTDAARPTAQRGAEGERGTAGNGAARGGERETPTPPVARRTTRSEPAPLRDGWVRVTGSRTARRSDS